MPQQLFTPLLRRELVRVPFTHPTQQFVASVGWRKSLWSVLGSSHPHEALQELEAVAVSVVLAVHFEAGLAHICPGSYELSVEDTLRELGIEDVALSERDAEFDDVAAGVASGPGTNL